MDNRTKKKFEIRELKGKYLTFLKEFNLYHFAVRNVSFYNKNRVKMNAKFPDNWRRKVEVSLLPKHCVLKGSQCQGIIDLYSIKKINHQDKKSIIMWQTIINDKQIFLCYTHRMMLYYNDFEIKNKIRALYVNTLKNQTIFLKI